MLTLTAIYWEAGYLSRGAIATPAPRVEVRAAVAPPPSLYAQRAPGQPSVAPSVFNAVNLITKGSMDLILLSPTPTMQPARVVQATVERKPVRRGGRAAEAPPPTTDAPTKEPEAPKEDNSEEAASATAAATVPPTPSETTE